MVKLIRQLHIYGALLCSGYLVVYAVSTVLFNHHLGGEWDRKSSWEATVRVPLTDDALASARVIRDEIGIGGWVLSWETGWDKNGDLVFATSHPGKKYKVRVLKTRGHAMVEETRTGPWSVVKGMHGMPFVPGSNALVPWAVYTEVSTWVMIFAALSGLFLWTRHRRERLIGAVLLVALGGGSMGWMAYLIGVG